MILFIIIPESFNSPDSVITSIYFVPIFVSIIPGISIQIRRIRDIGKSPEWILLSLIPFASLVLLFWYTRPSYSKTKDKLNSKSSQIEEQSLNQSFKNSERKVNSSFISGSGRNDINMKMDEMQIQLDRLKSMRNQGLITEEEYKSAKTKVLGI